MQMTHVTLLAVTVTLSGIVGGRLQAQTPAPKPNPNQLQVVAVVGCLAQDGTNFVLTNASGPIQLPASTDGKAQTGASVTTEKAKSQPVGKERYRLINMLDEFGVAGHKGHRVLAKGLITGDAKERRINLVSFEMVAPSCS
jgi:hypothetical protein